MKFVKSVLAGIAAVFLAFFLFVTGTVMYVMAVARNEPHEAIGWDPISLVRPTPLAVLFVIFLVGFAWEFRRASRRAPRF
jgi:uncharacterized BrkB/YihY/UPF0761 family membrane protein